MDNEYEYKKTNREKALTPVSGVYWCFKCDHYLVSPNRKCPNCGAKPLKKSIKKSS